MNQLLCALVAVSLGASSLLAENSPDLAQATVVIYNRKAAGSLELARFYSKARGIPADHLVGLECSTEEEISRQDYDATIAEPNSKAIRASGARVFISLHSCAACR